MSEHDRQPRLVVTERRQFQFDELDSLIFQLQNTILGDTERIALQHEIERLKFIISVQGSDGCEFEY